MKSRWLVIIMVACLLGTHPAVRESAAAEEVEHHCFGLLWCTDREGDHVSRDGFLWLYSSEERGPYSRLAIRPFYSEERDPTKDLLRRSILWPLGTYERSGDVVSSHIVPFYWHGEEPGKRYTVIPPLYADYLQGDHAYTFLLPLYVTRAQGGYYRQRFFLGPLFISTQNTRRDLSRWDFLFPLAGHSSSADGADTWLAPVYFAGHDVSTGHNYRFLLPLYGQSESLESRFRFFFPVFGSTQDDTAQLRRFSMLGLPPLPTSRTLPALAFYEHVTASDRTSDRFFPLYRYVVDSKEGTQLDVLLAYQHRASAQSMVDRLIPLYNIEDDQARPARDISVIGFRQWSLFRSLSDSSHWGHRLLGLYGYSHDRQNESSTLGVFGYGDLSVFRYSGTPSELSHRLFPLYRYRHDRLADETQYDMVFVYGHRATPTRTADHLLPLWDYESSRDTHDWRISTLGLAPFTIIHHQSSDEVTANHVFPLYGYRGSQAEGARFSLVGFPPTANRLTWSLYEHQRTGLVTADRLFPFYSLENDRATETLDFGALGFGPLTVFRQMSSPQETTGHFLPLYSYSAGTAGTRLDLMGISRTSLFEYEATPSLTAHRLFPLYAYSHDLAAHETRATALLLYWYGASADSSRHSVLPLFSLQEDRANEERTVAFLGLDPIAPVSWFRQTTGPQLTRGLLFPLYEYRRDGDDRSVSLGGMSELSLFRYQSSAAMTRHRFFPVYDYSRDQQRQSHALTALLLYRGESSPNKTANRLFPMWSYEDNRDTGETRLGIAGLAPLSLYQSYTTLTQQSLRLFPLFTQRTELATGMRQTDVLWPLLSIKSEHGETTEWSALWWLAHYEKPTSESFEFRLFGTSKMALLQRSVSPERSSLDLNPVLPLYSYSAEQGKGISWHLFGGLVGAETEDQGQTRLRLFWLRI